MLLKKLAIISLGLGGAATIYVVIARWAVTGELDPGSYEVPSLAGWGKIFSVLLLGTLGVAYLVWRRPVIQAQAILETSPLGTGQPSLPLVDWKLYLKTLAATELVAVIGMALLSFSGRRLENGDSLGVLVSGGIVALVIHLLILARRGERDHSR